MWVEKLPYRAEEDVLYGAEVEVRGRRKLLDLPQDKQIRLIVDSSKSDITNNNVEQGNYAKIFHISWGTV